MALTLKLALKIDDKEKTFLKSNIMTRLYRTAWDLDSVLKSEELSENEALDKLIEFVCLAFDNQFTYDDVLDGMPVDGMRDKLWGVWKDIVEAATGGATPAEVVDAEMQGK